MFKNLKKSKEGKISTKVLATFLVLTLTISNFALLRFIFGKWFNFICNK